ncbi:MAG: 3-hydroxyacyl-CoA dehydrogenase [Gammaproteobacteria bacterium]|jgi:3-hydroxyacyl-CoA dehydrogenase|nr:3-hydroxyacyl-CoA dehydrogenase [Gammaproteobacteria bacterium]MBT4615980.1 3-hydroxyacyl-CoA dehydrogenase [Gammaproteobacteria bacterium]MBT6668229.1 3-hydroxyacyl-CoA dehydrogenase [Gammaproteobacteria bacterium]MBT6949863.1 3-hydroxyacyl-CoA dehydrogenase [Gammaproteobacteria bacterium]MBT7531668.1 3-hydroxyacyl-CoA dehydrogenase [Gammaproteobacteria bacterium]
MKGTVHYEARGNIALLSIDNPPVNPLSSGVRQGLFDGVSSALADDAIEAIVLTGMHRAFIAGADISEFGAAATEGVGLGEALDKMEGSTKPIIAAINGTAFGGGLEVALCCDYRIAAAAAPVGLPEVKLGLLPGAGGTQRLPRLVGAEAAVQAIVSGNPIMAPDALTMGIVDRVASGDIIDDAIAYAHEIIADGAATRKVRDLEDKISADRGNTALFEKFAANLDKTHRGQFAPAQILQCVEAAVNAESFDEGMAVERARFAECMSDPQREALIHIFFAERAANKIPGLSKDVPLLDINKGSVIGAGTMGGGIAMCFANAGIPVRVHDNDPENLARGIKVIEGNYARTVSKGRLTQEEMDKRMSLIIPTENFDDLGDGDIVVEAVYENLDLKKEIFARLDKVMKQGALLATNTSGLDVDAIAGMTDRPEFVCGMHFFSPANVMRLLEVVRGKDSSPVVLGTAMALGKRLGKVSVMAGNCPGFIGNRMLGGYTRQAALMILEGATPAQVDKVIFDFGLAMGPFTMNDMVGLDLGWRARKMMGGTNEVTARIPDELCELGRYGQKNGKGYYQYAEGDRTPRPDPEADAVIAQVSEDLGYTRRDFSDDEILKRCMYPLVNIGAKLLEEGHALRAGDIDTVYVNGYGFPTYVGGPMWFADTQGLDNVLADMERFFEETGDDVWKPSDLLKKLVSEGKNFASLDG